jgi:integrase
LKIEYDRFIRDREKLLVKDLVTVEEIMQAYLVDRRADNRSTYKQEVSWRTFRTVFGPLHPEEIDKATCHKYWRLRADAGWSVGTTWTDLTVLAAALNWAVKAKKVKGQAPFIWKPQQPPPRDRVLTRDEADRLIAAARYHHLRLFIEVALATGARASAILELEWSRVDFDKGIIDFNTPASKGNRTKRRAVVPMTDAVRSALLEAKRGALTPWVFEFGGQRIRRVVGAFRRAADKAGLSDVSAHTLRHTAGAWMIEAGIDLQVIAQVLGHASTKVTEAVYARLVAETSTRLREATAALERRPQPLMLSGPSSQVQAQVQ